MEDNRSQICRREGDPILFNCLVAVIRGPPLLGRRHEDLEAIRRDLDTSVDRLEETPARGDVST